MRHTRQAIRRGLLQGYRREEEALHTVRGRIRFDDQINRRFGVPLPLEVAFDEFTEDIEENRMLKTALHRLAHLPVRSPQSPRDIHALRPAFNMVGLGVYRRGAAPEVQYTRLNQHYRPAVELARLIIENSSLELLHGNVTGASFLLDMNEVFEQFLFTALGEALGLSASEWKNGKFLSLDVGGKIILGLTFPGGATTVAGSSATPSTSVLGLPVFSTPTFARCLLTARRLTSLRVC